MIAKNPAATFWAAIALVAMVFLGVTALIGVMRGTSAVAAPAPAEQQLALELAEFSIEPAPLSAVSGAPIRLLGTNVGSTDHDITMDGIGTTGAFSSGEEAALDAGELEPGDYVVYCSIPGHRDSGMETTLTVTDGTGNSSATGGSGHIAADGANVDGDDSQHAAEMTPEEMVAGHEAGVAAFPAVTEAMGNQPLEPVIGADGVKEFRLTAEQIEWEVSPNEFKTAYAYNGMVPGPRIDVDLGDRVRIVLDNELPEPTALHSHGLIVPNDMDGVPGLTQDPIMPGESFTYEFEVRNAGSNMYHSHFNSAQQVPMGLLGAFVVHQPADPEVDVDYTMIINDGPLGFTINGKGFPATEPIAVQQGQRIRVRYMNEGLQIHPMHLHGMPQQVVAKDGWALPQPRMEDTVLVAPGERVDVIIEATEPGTWAFHCHILNHAEAADGMFGMVTALIVE